MRAFAPKPETAEPSRPAKSAKSVPARSGQGHSVNSTADQQDTTPAVQLKGGAGEEISHDRLAPVQRALPKGVARLVDNRLGAIAQCQLFEAMREGTYVVAQRKRLRGMFGDAAAQEAPDAKALQMMSAPLASARSKPEPVRTETPVCSISSSPAVAYAQSRDIHVPPGQEQHLPHEAWHVVPQAQGRVKPTLQMKVAVPDGPVQLSGNFGIIQLKGVGGTKIAFEKRTDLASQNRIDAGMTLSKRPGERRGIAGARQKNE
jgi:hypothetical protein